jgi:Asp-tRNA(Asn)/Glu-tRNA(Gln) amidotransferase A subunit family amidase
MDSALLEGYVPDVDATVVTRVLDAGGVIAGKVKCENLSRAGGSHTGHGGPVRDPHNPEHQRHYAKAQNLTRRLRAAYDAAFADHDLLLMPIVPHTAPRLPGPDSPIEERLAPSLAATVNTGVFNCTGHPAMSAPCGMVDGLAVGMSLVARWFGEPAIYQAAAAFEQAADWREL